ncbi:MAG: hypothetical protein WBP81_38655 [Solirubrobacteraceae bacterium]
MSVIRLFQPRSGVGLQDNVACRVLVDGPFGTELNRQVRVHCCEQQVREFGQAGLDSAGDVVDVIDGIGRGGQQVRAWRIRLTDEVRSRFVLGSVGAPRNSSSARASEDAHLELRSTIGFTARD